MWEIVKFFWCFFATQKYEEDKDVTIVTSSGIMNLWRMWQIHVNVRLTYTVVDLLLLQKNYWYDLFSDTVLIQRSPSQVWHGFFPMYSWHDFKFWYRCPSEYVFNSFRKAVYCRVVSGLNPWYFGRPLFTR